MKIILYSFKVSPRLSYTIDFFSKQINAEIIITKDIELFKRVDAVKINYSLQPITHEEFWVQPHTLLFENTILQQTIECFKWNNVKSFFRTEGDIPFDIFSATFYLLSRYEEYLPHEKDMYGRYAHTNSIAFKEDFLNLPLINLWIIEFRKVLQTKFSNYPVYESSQFSFLPTYDIDIAYAYNSHPLWKNFLGFFKDTRERNNSKWLERADVVIAGEKDPFDTYQWLDKLHVKYNLQPYYFFLVAEERKGYDKNISPHTKGMQQLIKQHAEKYETGIHPSWQSGDDENILRKEISLLQNITGKHVTKSRQHYIRMNLPDTYRLLIDNGIEEDHSMGYGSINGFRASIATSFYWYDLEKEQQTSLLIRPFCFMEANSFFEQHYTANQSGEELQQYYNTVKSVNGELITLFHNHFVTEQDDWLPWRNMYADFLRKNFG